MVSSKWILILWINILKVTAIQGAVLPPPWANPKINPCANQPGGWQLLYWPPDGKCYKIFKTGHPCPSDMELSPAATKPGEPQQFSAECRCPPSKGQSARDGKCYELYTRGPCDKGSYFAPDTKYNSNNNSKRQWGICVQTKYCSALNELYWAKDGRCYPKLTRGPCTKGSLLILNSDKIAECKCNKLRELRDYYHRDGNCYQHFTRGPCVEKGHLFLPDRSCGCHSFLPHFHDETKKCYEIGTVGPCNLGEQYQLHQEYRRGTCKCKKGYIRFANSTSCYRPFTQGPCLEGEFLINTTTCVQQPCQRGYLYFYNENKCFRIGTRGPCKKKQVVTFDFETRPSLDGISYNGVCSCQKHICDEQEDNVFTECNRKDGLIMFKNRCYKLYTQGPCPEGAWIAPKRHKRTELWDDINTKDGICECVPSYTKTTRTFKNKTLTEMICIPPTVILAEYLNKNFTFQL